MSKEEVHLNVMWSNGVVIIPAYQWSAFLLRLQKLGLEFNMKDAASDSIEGREVLKTMGLEVKK